MAMRKASKADKKRPKRLTAQIGLTEAYNQRLEQCLECLNEGKAMPVETKASLYKRFLQEGLERLEESLRDS